MPYEFTRLSEVNAIDMITEGMNVLVETEGDVVKIPVNSMVPEDVVIQSELETAISAIPEPITSWNDLTDRPFYDSGATIEWKGNGSDSSLTGSGYYYVSDLTPSKDEIVGAKYVWNTPTDGAQSRYVDSVNENDDGTAYDKYYFAVALNDNVTLADGTVLDKAGIYFRYSDNGYSYCSSLSWGGLVFIDEKFIPDTIARKSDILVAEAVPDALGDTPTATEFNALLNALRNAGLLAE